RRSLVTPVTLIVLLFGWTAMPGDPAVWTLATIIALTFSPSLWLVEAVASPRPWQPWRVMLRNLVDDTRTALARAGLQLIFLAYQAAEMAHAVVVTLVRVVFTHRKMLEWQPAAATARAAGGSTRGPRAFVEQMLASPALAALTLIVVAISRPSALAPAAPILALWTIAPFVAWRFSRPAPYHRPPLSEIDAKYLKGVARNSWKFFEEHVGEVDHWLAPDNCQNTPDAFVAHRTSPTNIGMCLLATLAAHDFEFIDTGTLLDRTERAMNTIESLERFEGHLLNWYDSSSLVPLNPRYVSSVDSGNLAASLITLAEGLRQLAAKDGEPVERLERLAQRAAAFADGMNFKMLYDEQRGLLSIGFRPADAEGPGRLDNAFYDLLATEARVASFVAIAKGDIPESHWFLLGRPMTSVSGIPTLLSWSSTMFEYLMPLLVLRSYPETLLDETCRMAVVQQMKYGESRHVPWGISECAYDVVDRHGTYQYKAFGVPGLGLKRGLGDELVVAPYATGLAAMIEPGGAATNFRRLAQAGAEGPYGFFESIDYTPRHVGENGAHPGDE